MLQLENALSASLDELDAARSSLEDLGEFLEGEVAPGRQRVEYWKLVCRIRDLVAQQIPRGARIAVVSKGDPKLLRLGHRAGTHFPQQHDGTYAGYHPACSLAAIAHLEALRVQGVQYLLVPRTAFWWFDYYARFKQHLDSWYAIAGGSGEDCVIYRLEAPIRQDAADWKSELRRHCLQFQEVHQRSPYVLDCHTSLPLAVSLPDVKVFQPPRPGSVLPYLDRTIDWVVTEAPPGSDGAREAARVAASALISVISPKDGEPATLVVESQTDPPRGERLPSVTVIFPCERKVPETDRFMRMLTRAIPAGCELEIMAVEGATANANPGLLRGWKERDSRMRVLRQRSGAGFAAACNQAAEEAKGEILVFISEDVLLLSGSLYPALRLFQNLPEAGAVGGRILDADGRLDGAGGLLFRDGSITGFGRGDANVERPVYQYVRKVDFCANGLFATRRRVWKEVQGFDLSRFPDGAYVEVDYGLKLQERGWSVYYQPELLGVHTTPLMRATGGGVDRNRAAAARLSERWEKHLVSRPLRPAVLDEACWRLHGMKLANAANELLP